MSDQTDKTSLPKKRGRGRPRKSELAAKSKGGRGVRGRPKGDAAIINDYKARMLASPKSESVLQKILDVALDDDHKNQAACMKMVVDRILPSSYFEKDRLSGGKSSVEVNLNFSTPEKVEIKEEDEPIDVEYTSVTRDNDAAD